MQKSKINQVVKSNILSRGGGYALVFLDGVAITDLVPEQKLPDNMMKVGISGHTCLTIAPDVVLPGPIHMLFLNTKMRTNGAKANYHNEIIVGNNSKVTFVEEHIALSGVEGHFSLSTYIKAKNGAQVAYHKIFDAACIEHEANLQLDLYGGSEITTNHIILGGIALQEKISVKLLEPYAVCNNIGLYRLRDKQKLVLDIALEHIAAYCKSKVLFKGIATDAAQANFSGKITVKAGAQYSKARLDNKNLLLQDTARIVSSPALEIYADDVQCSHGATIGQLDNAALWYLQSRGISEEMARQILVKAFLQEIINTLPAFLQTKINGLNNVYCSQTGF